MQLYGGHQGPRERVHSKIPLPLGLSEVPSIQEKLRDLSVAMASASGMPFLTSGATSSLSSKGLAGSGVVHAESATHIAREHRRIRLKPLNHFRKKQVPSSHRMQRTFTDLQVISEAAPYARPL